MDPTTALMAAGKLATKPVAKELIKRLAAYITKNDLSFMEARDELFREWVSELAVATNQVAEEVERLGEDIRRIEERTESHEAHRVLMNYAEQAYREPIDERRLMLAHAAAGILDVRLTVAQHAKVQRLLHELDPDDVLVLWGLSLTCGVVVDGQYVVNADRARRELCEQSGSRDMLLAAGLVGMPNPGTVGGMTGLRVTGLGDLVLRALRSFLATRKPPFEIPGREVFPGSRPESEARAMLRALPADVIAAAKSATSRQYEGPKRTTDGKRVIDPQPGAMGRLTLAPVAVELGARLVNVLPREAGRDPEMLWQPATRVRVTATPMPIEYGSEAYNVTVEGPHDVMRWLADDLESYWV